jgi:hypothetical protein
MRNSSSTKQRPKAVYTVEEAARLSGIARAEIEAAIESGKVFAINASVGSRAMWRIVPSSFAAWVSSRGKRRNGRKARVGR